MSVIVRRKQKSLSIEKSAWFLCRFLCRSLSEDNLEKVRDHVSTTKGVKTKLKLSEYGVEIGYKPSSVRHFHHKIKYEVLPLEAAENMIQDVVFINVLLCIFHVENIPGLEFEIIAFKFPNSDTVKRFQDIANILVGSMSQVKTYNAPGNSGNITLMPSKSYHMGLLAPEKWGSMENVLTKDGYREPSELSYTRPGRGVYEYGNVIPATEVPRRGHRLDVNDDDATLSVASSGQETFREGVRSTKLGRTPASSSNTRNEIQTDAATNYPNYLRAESASFDSSGVFDEDARGQVIHSNGVSLAYSSNRTGNKNITLKSMDVTDDAAQRHDHRVFKKRNIRSPLMSNESGISRDRYPSGSEFSYYRTRSQSVDQFNGGRMVESASRSDIYRPSDAMSVRSQTSYYLVPTFKKVYAPRSGRALSPGYTLEGSVYQDGRSRIYAGSEIRANGRY